MSTLTVSGEWKQVLRGKSRAVLEATLADFLPARRWFGGKARSIRCARIFEAVPFPAAAPGAYLLLIRVEYAEGNPERYLLPVTYAPGEAGARVERQLPRAVLARLRIRDRSEEGVLYDALWEKDFLTALFDVACGRQRLRGSFRQVTVSPPTAALESRGAEGAGLEASVLDAEQSNTSIVYGRSFILKVFRRLAPGVNPDLEIGSFLTARGFPHIPPVIGALEYRLPEGEATTLAILQRFVPNRGDAWRYTLEELEIYFEGLSCSPSGEVPSVPPSLGAPLDLIDKDPPGPARERFGPYLHAAELLGRRTAELHLALARDPELPGFAPEPFSLSDRLTLYRGMADLLERSFRDLRRRLETLPGEVRGRAREVLSREEELRRRFESLRDSPLRVTRIRCHGDYHLGQVLYTGEDFVILDFEGEPARPLEERRRKVSPLRDVAGMLRSFHYAAFTARHRRAAGKDTGAVPALEAWARFWNLWVGATFLKTYLEAARGAPFLPGGREELRVLLDAFVLEKAVYELGYELNNRPEWVRIPVQGILQLLGERR